MFYIYIYISEWCGQIIKSADFRALGAPRRAGERALLCDFCPDPSAACEESDAVKRFGENGVLRVRGEIRRPCYASR